MDVVDAGASADVAVRCDGRNDDDNYLDDDDRRDEPSDVHGIRRAEPVDGAAWVDEAVLLPGAVVTADVAVPAPIKKGPG